LFVSVFRAEKLPRFEVEVSGVIWTATPSPPEEPAT